MSDIHAITGAVDAAAHLLGVVDRVSGVVAVLVGQIILVNGGSDGHGWIGPAIIAAFIASPFVVGLTWRLVDRRRGRRARDDA